MTCNGLRQAAQVLRTHLATLPAADRAAQLSAMANLIYADRLNQPPIDPNDPDALDQICQRFSDIVADHLDLEAAILTAAAQATDRPPLELLDQIVTAHLGGYDTR
jgi:hypothetical protein